MDLISSQRTVTYLDLNPISGDLEGKSCKTRSIHELGVWHDWKWVRYIFVHSQASNIYRSSFLLSFLLEISTNRASNLKMNNFETWKSMLHPKPGEFENSAGTEIPRPTTCGYSKFAAEDLCVSCDAGCGWTWLTWSNQVVGSCSLSTMKMTCRDTVRIATKLYGIWGKGPSDPGEA